MSQAGPAATRPKRAVFRDGLLDGRVALVTGGSAGIGLGIADVLGSLGASLVITGRRADRLAEAAEALAPTGARIVTVAADVRDYAATQGVIARTVEAFGALDILVNNAAGNFNCPFDEMTPNGWRAVVDIDLNGTFNFCHAGFRALAASAYGGRVINISLAQVGSGWPGAAHAASAKAGVTALTRSLAVEWGPHGIRVNNILPGPIEGTEGLRKMYEEAGVAEKERGRMALGHFGDLDDIAMSCAFLASPAGDFITGCDMTVDGGRWLKRAWT